MRVQSCSLVHHDAFASRFRCLIFAVAGCCCSSSSTSWRIAWYMPEPKVHAAPACHAALLNDIPYCHCLFALLSLPTLVQP